MNIVQLESGEFGILIDNHVIPFSEMEDLGLPQNILARLENYGKGRDNDLFELVKREGLEKEYCLVFMNKICFHSTSLEEIKEYEKNHAIAFTRYGPI